MFLTLIKSLKRESNLRYYVRSGARKLKGSLLPTRWRSSLQGIQKCTLVRPVKKVGYSRRDDRLRAVLKLK